MHLVTNELNPFNIHYITHYYITSHHITLHKHYIITNHNN